MESLSIKCRNNLFFLNPIENKPYEIVTKGILVQNDEEIYMYSGFNFKVI